MLYTTVDAAMVLSQVKRQNDTCFLDVLHNISCGTLSEADYNILKQRFTTSVSEEERKSFKDAIRLYPTRAEVDEHNKNCLVALKHPTTGNPMPISRIPAQHNSAQARDGTENEAGGLRNTLYLAKGARIMLRANLWTEKGLVNGSMGEVVDILYAQDRSPPDDAPVAIICKFDCYQGLYLDDLTKTVVITPITKQWKSKNGQDCIRQQFPTSLCYACSIHKSQGLTLDKANVNIGTLKEMSPGLTYTAVTS
ncbi:hypothetical protein FOCC_FOCC016071 [Frankliniella occidentalis]|uniref:ATP-dependent DNA helicase PIF1-like n=1 Tax=Frankliniella occidentalis TaxID=133901 RepID=A0A6J1TBR4_FRAOC|nr:ATP-dependent DNA helicase PIF1-like [Frankliniella occidentalis]KAE8738448.1 hypothetical protein FOCC_FOCC016071 [Frankliniella occidentalis]